MYALLLSSGFELEKEYNNRLDELFLQNPADIILLDLEFMSNDIEQSIVYIRTNINYDKFDYDIFGCILMKKLKEYYINTEIKRFAEHMYSLWETLPGHIQDKEPFFTLCYADDALSYDEVQTRKLYEEMLTYYE